MQRGTKTGLTVLCISLLFLACTIRSGIVVDHTFVPRFTILALVIFCTWAAGANRLIHFHNNIFEISFVLFYGWSLLSTFWSIEPSEAIIQSQLVFLSLALFLLIYSVVEKHPGFEHLFIKTHLLVLLLSYGLAFYKMSTLVYYDPYRIISIAANNNLYTGYLLISLPLLFTGYILLPGGWKYLSVLMGILAIFFIIIIQSRAAYLGLAMALLISAVFLKIYYPETFRAKNILTGLISILLLVSALAIFTITLDHTLRQYFLRKIMVWQYFRSYDDLRSEKIRKLNELEENTKMAPFDFSEAYYSNANWRMIFWQKSFGLIKTHPVIGVGAGNWRLAVPSVIDPPNPEHTIGNFTYSEPHNEWIRILTELGSIGFLLALIVFLIPPAAIFYRIIISQQKPPPETLFYAAFILGFYLFATFDFPLRRVEHNIILWSVFAFMLHKVPLPSTPFLKRWNLYSGWWSFIFLGLIIFSLLIAAVRIRGEYFTLQFFRNERKNDRLVVSFCRMAENSFYRLTPNTLPVSWFEGVAHYRLGENEIARNCFLRALKVTPYEVRVLNDYGASLFRSGQSMEAIEALKKALVIDPYFDEARFNLGAVYFLTGQREYAKALVMGCRESKKKHDFLEEMK